MADLNIINVGGVDYNIADATARSNVSGKAPIYHASSDTTYGIGDSNKYGHCKAFDTYTSAIGGAVNGMVLSQLGGYMLHEHCRLKRYRLTENVSSSVPGYYLLGSIGTGTGGSLDAGYVISVNVVSHQDKVVTEILYDEYETGKFVVGVYVWSFGNYQLSPSTERLTFDVIVGNPILN